MKSKDEFKDKFRFTLVGMTAWCQWAEERGTPVQAAKARLDMPGNIDVLLGLMYDFLAKDEKTK